MVLQRDQPVAIWGTASPGEEVAVEFAAQKASGPADARGNWMLWLGPFPANSSPQPLRISGRTTIEFHDVLVGELWICAGQSNMQRRLGPVASQKPVARWQEATAAADYPEIRAFVVSQNISPDAPAQHPGGKWVTCSPQTAPDFPAVPFFFARDLHAHLDVPVGIVVAAVGGSPIEAWMSREALASIPEGRPALETENSVPHEKACGLFNGMITPLVPLGIRGILWYQGESNRRSPTTYAALISTLIAEWRALWGIPDMPFLMVQLPPHREVPPELREAQRLVHQTTNRTAMVCIIDHGDAGDFHPSEKEPVGQRLALAARAIAYGESVIWSGPAISHTERTPNGIVLHFDFTAGGLDTTDHTAPRGFELAGKGGVFHHARAVLCGDRVVLNSETVPSPAFVRYGWANLPNINLTNTHGLPASPFFQSIKP